MSYSKHQARVYSRGMDKLTEEAGTGTKWAKFLLRKEAGNDYFDLDAGDSGEEPTKANTEYRPPMMINFLTEIEKEELAIKHNIF